ncbi:hypothetical protein C0991_000552 [Blastosporella zonata]|nr:hypothetical protein C0991_000552 [Blastosporella zonata]
MYQVQAVPEPIQINPPEVYDGRSKQLADQFLCQVKAAAEFEVFCDDKQKILWAQSFLTGTAQDWSCVITTSLGNPALNPCHFSWSDWIADFRAAYCTCNPAQDALTQIAALQQGSKTITEYCTAFVELKGKLGPADAEGEWVKERFWKGLSAATMEALINSNKTVEEARDILLQCETKLADIAVRRKGSSRQGLSLTPWALAASVPAPAWVARLVASKDPDAMDIDCGRHSSATRKCFKCHKESHFAMDCPDWLLAIKSAVREVVQESEGAREDAPAAGFV